MLCCAVDVNSNQEMLGERNQTASIFGRMCDTNLYWETWGLGRG